MSEIGDDFRALRIARQEQGEDNRQVAARQFPECRDLAASVGLILVKCSDTHYRLHMHGKKGAFNIYPGNRRIYRDPATGKTPGWISGLSRHWTLSEVIQAIVNAKQFARLA